MPVFVAGLVLGATSGGLTYALSFDGHLALIAAGAAAVLTWHGCAAVIIGDD